MKNSLKIKKDILYLLIIYFLTEFFQYSVLNTSNYILIVIGFLGLLTLETWFVMTYSLYSKKKISKYSDVVMKISLKKRFFSYFVLPAIFYISILFFLFFNRNIVLGNTILIVCMILILMLFLNVKGSLNKYYSLEIFTRAVFDFICITILYLVLNSLLRIGFSLLEYSILSFISSLILFIFILKLHNKFGLPEVIISIISSILVVVSMILFWDSNVFVIPAIGALMFYLIVSLWNIRFSGKVKLSEYFVPIVYSILALILILTI